MNSPLIEKELVYQHTNAKFALQKGTWNHKLTKTTLNILTADSNLMTFSITQHDIPLTNLHSHVKKHKSVCA